MKNSISIEIIVIEVWFISFTITYLAIPCIVDILHHIKLFLALLPFPEFQVISFLNFFLSQMLLCS